MITFPWRRTKKNRIRIKRETVLLVIPILLLIWVNLMGLVELFLNGPVLADSWTKVLVALVAVLDLLVVYLWVRGKIRIG